MKPPVKFYWKGNHHSYYGVFFIAFGLFNVYMGTDNGNLSDICSLWWTITGIGAFMVIDDIIEHKVTSETPLRKIYLMLFKLKE
jgi:uncharacterized membrane protein